MGTSQAKISVMQSVIAEASARGGRHLLTGRFRAGADFANEVEVVAEVLGSGMSGDVRAAVYRAGGVRCAVKTLRTRGLSAEKLRFVKNELELLALVDHPLIASLLGVYESASGDLHLVMEQLRGGEVFDRLAAQGRFQEAEAASIVVQMLLSLSYLHAHGIVHRDLKLENFIFDAEDSNCTKLIDFGLARRWSVGDAKMTFVCGSRDYMAPEVLARCYAQKADIWSLGVMAFTLLCGVLPWKATHNDVWKDIREGNVYFHPELFPALSGEAQRFVRSLLAVDPSRRPAGAMALQDPWLCGHRVEGPAPCPKVARRLCDYVRASPPQRAVRAAAAWQLASHVCLGACRLQFYAFTRGSDATPDVTELRELFLQLGVDATDADECLSQLVDDAGMIPFSTFMAAAAEPEQFDGGVCQSTFARFDLDGDGFVKSSDFWALGFEDANIAGQGLSLAEFSHLLSKPVVARARGKKAMCQQQGRWLSRCAWCRTAAVR